ncbi:hypothetical protein EZV61_15835 [Corallincola luteus]|uniref:Glycosyl hydrolase family 13 catalytic domain-containing protein n=1 Tax=Corallincola luteus TaxID=1775177 RepID=A0ABY2AKW0_9GAMM|nr:hypothetical protein EZV61_15835 [Corallincola luteus]
MRSGRETVLRQIPIFSQTLAQKLLISIVSSIVSVSALASAPDTSAWYRQATGYHIWIKSFADSNDEDQVGDIQGIIDRFGYLNDGDPDTGGDLGIDLILLSPFYLSERTSDDPMDNIHGYDVLDYYTVNPRFGDEKTLKSLLELAHQRGVKVLFDFVPGYTSIKHPWFIDSAAGGQKRNWYVWQDQPSNDWQAAWGGGQWHDVWKPHGDRYFYTYFQSAEIADLNLHNPYVRAEMEKVLKYWLDFGFDGARVDGAPYLIEDGPGLQADRAGTFKLLQDYRSIADSYSPAKVLLAETWRPREQVGNYFGDGSNQIHLGLDFNWAWAATEVVDNIAPDAVADLKRYQRQNFPSGYQMATFLSNHDSYLPRPLTRYEGNANKAFIAAAMQILGQGTPMIFYGNELGLKGKPRPDAELRALFNWQDVERQTAKPHSLLSGYRDLLQIRHQYQAITHGSELPVVTRQYGVSSFMRLYQGSGVVILINASSSEQQATLDLMPFFKSVESESLSEDWAHLSLLLGKVKIPAVIDSVTASKVEVARIPPNSVTVLYLGAEPQKLIDGYYPNVVAPTTLPNIQAPALTSLFLRGSMNDWGGSLPMSRGDDGLWSIVTQLSHGRYEYKFEVSGQSSWGLNWGDNENDQRGEVDGSNIRLQLAESGCYQFWFDEVTRRYGFQLAEGCD